MALTTAEEIELLALLEQEFADRPAWAPQPTNEPQNIAYNSPAQQIYYGGAKGGGKSQLGLGLSSMKHWYINCFRKNYDEHSAMIEIIKTEFPPRVNPHLYYPTRRERRMKVREMRFCHLQNGEKDLRKYQGKRVDLLWIDECVHFSRKEIDTLAADINFLRDDVKADGVKCQLLCTFNPPLDQKGMWIFEVLAPWINDQHPMYPQPSGKVLWCCRIGGIDYFYEENQVVTHHPATGEPLKDPRNLVSRTFIRATLFDNEAYRHDLAYHAQLQGLDDVEYRAFFLGEMTASLVDDAKYIFPRSKYIACEKRWKETEPPKGPPLVVAIDVTGGGEDQFCMMPMWKGGYAGKYVQRQGSLLPNADAQVDFLEEYVQGTLHCAIMDIDYIYDSGGGYGDAFHDAMMRRYPEARLNAFRGGGAAGINDLFGINNADEAIGELSGMPFLSGSNGFTNCVSAAWCRAGQMTYHPLFNLAIYPDDDLRRQCTGREITERGGGKLAIEKKEDYKAKLGGKSPDAADCLVMGLWYLSVVMAVAEWSQRSR